MLSLFRYALLHDMTPILNWHFDMDLTLKRLNADAAIKLTSGKSRGRTVGWLIADVAVCSSRHTRTPTE